jgi:cysteinyl-tRNA synthetase
LIGGHYRQPLNFTWASLEGARAGLRRLDEFGERLGEIAAAAKPGPMPDWAMAHEAAFVSALEDDLNLPAALAAVFDLVREGHRAADAGALTAPDAAAVRRLLERWDRVLGVLASAGDGVPAEIAQKARRREEARRAQRWDEADRLREEMKASGWIVQDTPTGSKVRRA